MMKNHPIKTRAVFGSLQPRTICFHQLRNPQHARALREYVQQSDATLHDELFRYTSGRWIFSEHLRLAERFLEFDVSALQNVVSAASGHSISDLRTFIKLSEGGFNRVFQATFNDGKCVIARLPYPSTVPEHYTVASEAATLDYLHLHGIRTPELTDPNGMAFCIGLIAHYDWWHDKRDLLNVDRGPWLSSMGVFRAAGERELAWTKAYAKPRLPYDRLYREIYYFKQVSPDSHITGLSKYLEVIPFLAYGNDSTLNRPVMRHPDVQPNNILVSDSNDIIGLIDWQHCSILPLGIAAGIPFHFQNYGDPKSEMLKQPQLALPPDYDSLPSSEQASLLETRRKRLIHFLTHSLYTELADNCADQRWRSKWECLSGPSADITMEETRHALGVDVLGWVPNDDYDAVKEMAHDIKTKMLEAAETPEDVIGTRDHFPFDDFDEST
ncbi:hypothetical protein RU639_002894 [Aspergillus parasiticus]